MPYIPKGVFDTVSGGDLDASKAACREWATLKRAKLANSSKNASFTLASHAADLVARYGHGIYAGYMPSVASCRHLFFLRVL